MVTTMNQRDDSQLELLLLPIGFLFISIGAGELLRATGLVASNGLFSSCWIFPAILIACCLVLLSGPRISTREHRWLQLFLAWLMLPATGIPCLSWSNSWPLLVSALGTTVMWEYLKDRVDSSGLKETTR